MRTITSIIDLYNSVFRGNSCFSNGYIISSNGVQWLVDGRPVNTIENKKRELEIIVTRVELAKELLISIDEDINKMYGDYYLIFDSNMVFLVKFSEDYLVIIHMTESLDENNVMIEQIDVKNGTMKCHYFKQTFDELNPKQFYLEGDLSAKSKKLLFLKLKEQEISITQNFYYDMIFEGMASYHDLIQAIIESPSKQIKMQLRVGKPIK